MNWYPLDPEAHQFWKIFPLRIPGGLKCEFCGEETLLVQSMEGGFVTRNCPRCSFSKYISERDFQSLGLYVACPTCKARMTAGTLPDRNYGFRCATCDLGISLHSLLPRYSEL